MEKKEIQDLQGKLQFYKSKYDSSKADILVKEKQILELQKTISGMKEEVYKTREEYKAKNDMYNNASDSLKTENHK